MITRQRVIPNRYVEEDDHIRVTVYGMKKEVTGEVIVDKKDLQIVSGYKWHIKKRNGMPMAVMSRKGGSHIRLHHLIMGAPPEGKEYDHINRNPLDNRRKNLRICTLEQNQWNRGLLKRNISGYKGVALAHDKKHWTAVIWHESKPLYIGCFDDPRQAAYFYNEKALELKGNFAYVNKIF